MIRVSILCSNSLRIGHVSIDKTFPWTKFSKSLWEDMGGMFYQEVMKIFFDFDNNSEFDSLILKQFES